MNRAELREELGFLINFNDGQADQAFSSTRLNKILNQAYNRLVHRLSQESLSSWFKKTVDTTWSSGEVTFQPGAGVTQHGLIDVRDVTNDSIGAQFLISASPVGGHQVFWKDYQTLQWGTAGPSSDVTLRWYYFAAPEELVIDTQVPSLIPAEFHEAIVWEAGCIARQIADEEAPRAWVYERDNLFMDLMKHMSRARVQSDPPWLASMDVDDSIDLPTQDGSSISV